MLYTRWAGLLLLFAGSMTYPIAAQAQQPLPPIGRGWAEVFRSRTPLSGVLVPGVTSGDPEALARTDTITLWLSAASSGPLCVVIQSQDGRYTAQARFQLTGGSAPATTIIGPTGYRKELRRYRASQLAVSAILSEDCQDPRATHVVPQLGTNLSQPPTFSLLLNTRDYTDVIWRGLDGQLATTRCPETAERSVVFNRVCRVPTVNLRSRMPFIVRQRRDGRTFVYDTVLISIPQ
jgi:hypothetical protein